MRHEPRDRALQSMSEPQELPDRGPEPEDLEPPLNRPEWGQGRPVFTPLLGVLLMIVVVLGIFALIMFLRYNT